MVSATLSENVVAITGVRFCPAGRIYYFDPQGQSYNTGQFVIVETVRGTEAGRVVIASKKMAEKDLSDPLKPVLRLATEDELRLMLSFKSKEKEALVKCAERVTQHALPMKLVEAEYTFDGSRLTFYLRLMNALTFARWCVTWRRPFVRVSSCARSGHATRPSCKEGWDHAVTPLL